MVEALAAAGALLLIAVVVAFFGFAVPATGRKKSAIVFGLFVTGGGTGAGMFSSAIGLGGGGGRSLGRLDGAGTKSDESESPDSVSDSRSSIT